MDETGFSTVQTKPPKVLAQKGQHQVGGISSSERGVNTTVVMAMSASGEYLPPMFIFARQRMNDALKIGAPEGSVFACNPSGWSSLTTCSDWFDHFLAYTRPSADSPVLLILDGHSTHTRNLPMLEKAKKNYVRIVSIPPHTSHKIQPLDVALMGPLKSHFATAIGNFLKTNPGKAITPYNICALVNYAFVKSANMQTAQSGFRATGIHPFDPAIFTDSDFSAADFLIRTNTKDKSQDTDESLNSQAGDILAVVVQTGNVQAGDVQAGDVHAGDVQAGIGINAVDSNTGVLSDTITIDQIDANEYYVIQSNGDIIIGPVSNLYSIITNSDETVQSTNQSFGVADVYRDATLEPTQHSMLIDGQHDEGAPVDCGTLVAPTEMLEQENVPPDSGDTVLQDTAQQNTEEMVSKKKKKRNRSAALQLLPGSDPDADSRHTKKGRWDQNTNRNMPKLDSFAISPSSVARKLENRMDIRRKKAASRKEHAAELTSSPHRKKLIETTALKDRKNIQKTGRKRTGRKAKVPVIDAMDDILCFICGTTFSVSRNGKGWSKCIHCQEWFHASCSTDVNECFTCSSLN